MPLEWILRRQPAAEELFYWDAFWELSSERQLVMGGVGPIPGSKIREFAAIEGVEGEIFHMFRRVIRAMDMVFIKNAGRSPTEGEEDD